MASTVVPAVRSPDLSEAVRHGAFAVAFALLAAVALSLAVRSVGRARWAYVDAKDALLRRWAR